LLAKLAFDLFAIPGMSSKCERVFSNGKKLVTDERYNLKADIIKADQCLKNWFVKGLADGAVIFLDINKPEGGTEDSVSGDS
jgi:hypothetical protein